VLLISLNLISCASSVDTNCTDNKFVFFDSWCGALWASGIKIDLEENEKERGRLWHLSYCVDPVALKLLTFSKGSDNEIYFYDITSGKIEDEIEIRLRSDVSWGFFVHDNKAVLTLKDEDSRLIYTGKYVIVDLLSKRSEYVIIDSFQEIFHGKWKAWLCGFDGRTLLFYDGYFDLSDNTYRQYKMELSYPRYMSRQRKIMGLDSDNNIILYDHYTGEMQNFGKKRTKPFSGYKYSENDLYYYDGDFLYVSKDIRYTFALFIIPAKRKWYRYNLGTNKKELLSVPSEYSQIIWVYP
jgi:hypothetical protein